MTQSKLEAQLQAARERVAKLEAQLAEEKNKPTINVGDIVTGEYGRKNKVLVHGPVIAIEGNQALVQGNGLSVHKFFLKDLLVQTPVGGDAVPGVDIPGDGDIVPEDDDGLSAEDRVRQQFQNDPFLAAQNG